MTHSSLISLLLLTACQPVSDKAPAQAAVSPADTVSTLNAEPTRFLQPTPNLSKQVRDTYNANISLFTQSYQEYSGFGPLFNGVSCQSCHYNASRSALIEAGISSPNALVMKLAAREHFAQASDPVYGQQLQTFSTQASDYRPESEILLDYQLIQGRFSDGEAYELRQPNWQTINLNYGPLAQTHKISPRLAPKLVGLGLLDAISDKDLLKLEDVDDNDGDGISAKYNWVIDRSNGEIDIGRFGFKSSHPNLLQQISVEFNQHMGLANALAPREDCPTNIHLCKPAVSANQYIEQQTITNLLKLLQQTSLPGRKQANSTSVTEGKRLFTQIGCVRCHQPSFTTAEDYPVSHLAGLTIWPYSDLALHDMGDGLADNSYEQYANGHEWRTAPLWGIGWQEQISPQINYLHDGRARNLTEAIMWHGGEGLASKQAFAQLTKVERQAVLTFIRSL